MTPLGSACSRTRKPHFIDRPLTPHSQWKALCTCYKPSKSSLERWSLVVNSFSQASGQAAVH